MTSTESAEYRPRWSPDGKTIVHQATKRGLTDLETTMEDTHIWLINADGTNRREISAMIDNRQGAPAWSADGKAVFFTVQEKGNVRLYRLPVAGGTPEAVVNERGTVGSWSASKDNSVAYAFASPSDLPQLYLKSGGGEAKKLTNLNAEILAGKQIAEVESFTFISNDNKYTVEAFITKPIGMTSSSKHPLIVNIHGGPHGQQGPAFNFKHQVYASRGWATPLVNYRDVPIAEAEQYYIALRDVGVEATMVRYPREGHGIREPRHVVDSIDRCINWYVKHFPSAQ